MDTMSGLPDMPQVSAWDTDHLSVAAARWRGVAQSWDQVFATLEREIVTPGGTPWLRDAAEGAQQRCAFDRVKVGSAADNLYSAAEVAGRGADRLAGAKQIVLDAVTRARDDGFTVGDDFSVSDPQSPMLHATAVEREAQAQAHAVDIRVKVAALVQADREIAAAIREVGGRIGDINFDSSIQALDGEQGEVEPPRTRGLPPEGLRPPVEGDLSPGPASRPSEARKGGQSLWDEHGGEWRYFPGDRYHNPHWDYNPHDSPRAGWENRPIGDLPPVKGDPGPADTGPPVTIPPLPPVSSDDITIGGILAGTAAAGAWILSQIGKLTHPFS